jgi:glucose-6-phosphate isomerase
MSLTYDFHAMPKLSGEAWSAATVAYVTVQEHKSSLGFAKLPYANISEIKALAQAVVAEVEAVILIGIGGSDLGARAVHRALNHQFYNQLSAHERPGPRLYFLGDTTDPRAIQEVLDVVDLNKTAVVIVSKSGNTIEQMSTFVLLESKLRSVVGDETLKGRIIIVTDGETGTLREIVRRQGYRSLVAPGEVGGRFSVLSAMGLLVLAIAGIDVDGLLAGARWLDTMAAKDAATDPALRFAAQQHTSYLGGQHISVLMPYSYALRETGFWFRQIWAESLGKREDRSGATVNSGPTPIAAVGPTDQHSQLQLYREGPRDKVFTFIGVEEQPLNVELPMDYHDLEGVAYLAGHHFGEILQAELDSTAQALFEDGRPSAVIMLERLDAFHLGALVYFFELATAYSGELYGINAYDQPGVELSKNIMYGLLKRPGYEECELPKATDEEKISLV